MLNGSSFLLQNVNTSVTFVSFPGDRKCSSLIHFAFLPSLLLLTLTPGLDTALILRTATAEGDAKPCTPR